MRSISTVFIMGLSLILTRSVYAFSTMHYAQSICKACRSITHNGIELTKKHYNFSMALIMCSATVLLINKIKHRCIQSCALSGKALCYKFWHILGGRINTESASARRAFFKSVRANNLWLTRQMLTDGINVNDTYVLRDNASVLHEAARLGYTRMLELQLLHGANTLAKDHHNNLALHKAAQYNKPEIARVLLEERSTEQAQLAAHNIEGKTPLHIAAEHGARDVAAILLDHKAPLEKTVLHLAAQKGNAEIIQLLLDHGADKNALDDKQKTAFYYAQLYWKGFPKKQNVLKLLEPAQ